MDLIFISFFEGIVKENEVNYQELYFVLMIFSFEGLILHLSFLFCLVHFETMNFIQVFSHLYSSYPHFFYLHSNDSHFLQIYLIYYYSFSTISLSLNLYFFNFYYFLTNTQSSLAELTFHSQLLLLLSTIIMILMKTHELF